MRRQHRRRGRGEVRCRRRWHPRSNTSREVVETCSFTETLHHGSRQVVLPDDELLCGVLATTKGSGGDLNTTGFANSRRKKTMQENVCGSKILIF